MKFNPSIAGARQEAVHLCSSHSSRDLQEEGYLLFNALLPTFHIWCFDMVPSSKLIINICTAMQVNARTGLQEPLSASPSLFPRATVLSIGEWTPPGQDHQIRPTNFAKLRIHTADTISKRSSRDAADETELKGVFCEYQGRSKIPPVVRYQTRTMTLDIIF